MKDPILKYIEENRESLDSKIPANANWDKIQAEIAEKPKKKPAIWYASGIAAVLIVGLLIVNPFKTDSGNYADNETKDIVTDAKTIRTEDIDYRNENQFELSSGDKSQIKGFRNIVTHSNREVQNKVLNNEYTYAWTKNGVTGLSDGSSADAYNVTVKNENGCSIDENTNLYSYGNIDVLTVDDGSPKLTLKANGTKPLPFSGGSYPVNEPETLFNQGTYYTEAQTIVHYDVDRYYEPYEEFTENAFETTLDKPLSTYGIDVDGAGYSNVRRFIQGGYLPPKNAVKLEEMINYFDYYLPEPKDDHPFSITTEVGKCPWAKNHLLMQVALKGEEIKMDKNQSNNLVFLIDVSGSMESEDKLPLLKKSLNLLVEQMGSDDRIALVVYSGSSGLVLPSTSGRNKAKIYDAIENLSAGGSTAGGAGIELAYKIANEAKINDGNNRVIMATDGDFNVGISSDTGLVKLIEEKRKSNVYLSVLGFGTGNLQSNKMEKLANNGNGNYYYIDNLLEAKKVLVDEIGGTLITIAKDVKLQIEFNPEHVKGYRLLGYENRMLSTRDFDDDTKDAGELGSGHTIVALYEIITNNEKEISTTDNLRYQKTIINQSNENNEELALIKFRYKKTNTTKSQLIEQTIDYKINNRLTKNFLFASAVAEFGMLLRNSEYKGKANFESVIKRASLNKGKDEMGYRAEFIRLVTQTSILMKEYKDLVNN
ncbi:vWA domain-containing protein [Crocinitomix catalasitica]|uniref:vWA domain-containing protein n=1 Tax=Crocinitomix catalasitica TaxID=184607 RepID=UPI000685FFF8|nr:von Willebrand factor type A domain-containing protein [Crocinitomix catalasitica]